MDVSRSLHLRGSPRIAWPTSAKHEIEKKKGGGNREPLFRRMCIPSHSLRLLLEVFFLECLHLCEGLLHLLHLLHLVHDKVQPLIDEIPYCGPDRFRPRGKVIDLHEEVESAYVPLGQAKSYLFQLSVFHPRTRRQGRGRLDLFCLTNIVMGSRVYNASCPRLNSKTAKEKNAGPDALGHIKKGAKFQIRFALLGCKSRLSSVWLERLTVVRLPACRYPAVISRRPVQIRESGLSLFSQSTRA